VLLLAAAGCCCCLLAAKHCPAKPHTQLNVRGQWAREILATAKVSQLRQCGEVRMDPCTRRGVCFGGFEAAWRRSLLLLSCRLLLLDP
jgi:hypothetical protein